MKKVSKAMFAIATLAIVSTPAFAVGVVDAATQQGVDDFNATWAIVKPIMYGVGLAFLCWGLLKRTARKA